MRHGYAGTLPVYPQAAVSLKMLELFHVLGVRAPQLSIQKFVRAICDLHNVSAIHFAPYTFANSRGQITYRATLRCQFSVAYDMYLEVQHCIQTQLDIVLGRSADDWHIKTACPACMFKIVDDPNLAYGFLVTMDGNDSLKRVERVMKTKDANGKTVGTTNIEAYNSQRCKGKTYIHSEVVDVFKDEVKQRKAPQVQMQTSVLFDLDS